MLQGSKYYHAGTVLPLPAPVTYPGSLMVPPVPFEPPTEALTVPSVT